MKKEEFINNRHQLSSKFKKTQRTLSVYPVLDSVPVFDKPNDDWHSSEYIRLITHEVTGVHTFHAPDNLVILMEFLNYVLAEAVAPPFDRVTLKNGNAYFYWKRIRLFSFNFERSNSPTTDAFLYQLNKTINA